MSISSQTNNFLIISLIPFFLCLKQIEGVKVLILNPHHCDLCTGVVHALGTLLIGTGHIDCEVDIFTPVRDMCDGLASWTQDMILSCDHVIIPWLCKVNAPNQGKIMLI